MTNSIDNIQNYNNSVSFKGSKPTIKEMNTLDKILAQRAIKKAKRVLNKNYDSFENSKKQVSITKGRKTYIFSPLKNGIDIEVVKQSLFGKKQKSIDKATDGTIYITKFKKDKKGDLQITSMKSDLA